jgi:hypothetical protein
MNHGVTLVQIVQDFRYLAQAEPVPWMEASVPKKGQLMNQALAFTLRGSLANLRCQIIQDDTLRSGGSRPAVV